MPYPDKYVSKIEDVPSQKHYAIFRQKTIHVPGDERSRTNPGHGYPAYTEYSLNYEAYLTFDSLLAAINADVKRLDQIRIAKITPLKIKTELKVDIL